jgi:hypothetical protein
VTNQDGRPTDEEVSGHFLPGPDGGQVCDRCRCIVRATKGDARAHLAWHDRLEGTG